MGVGGISTGHDVIEFMMAGADMVQACTIAMFEGNDCFGRICRELEAIMLEKGVKSVSEFKNQAVNKIMQRPAIEKARDDIYAIGDRFVE